MDEDQDQSVEDERLGDTEPRAGGGQKQPKKKGAVQQAAKKAVVEGTKKLAETAATAITSETGGWGGTAVKIAEYGAKLANTLRRLEKAGEVIREGVQEAKKFGKYLGYICSLIAALLIFFIMLFSQTSNTAVQLTSQTASGETTQIIKTGPDSIDNNQNITYSIQVSDVPGVTDISVVDTIPANATYVGANGVPHVDTAANTVTWSTKESFPATPNNVTFTITLKPSYPNSYVINYAQADSSVGTLSCGEKSSPPSGGLPGYTCTSSGSTNWGIEKMSDSYYYATSFGCSTQFGGDPNDNCVPACTNSSIPECATAGKTGKACEETLKWFAADAGRFGCNALLKVTNPLTGAAVVVRSVDRGPACFVENRGGRGVVDLSKDASNALFGSPSSGVSEKKSIKVEEISDPNTPLGPIAACTP